MLLLGICLKRYKVLPNGQAERRSNFVDIPLEIGLPHFIQDDNMLEDGPVFGNFKLSLQSAVCHQGTRVDAGHYIGLVRAFHAGDPTAARWLRHDDLAKERVAEVDIEQFLRDETPYLLFYQVVPIDGDPGNIVEGETATDNDDPPAYSENWIREADDDLDRKFSLDPSIGSETDTSDTAIGESNIIHDRQTSSASIFGQGLTNGSSDNGGTVASTRPSIDGTEPNSITVSRRSSKANGLGVSNGSATQAEGNRLSASMSRLAGRWTRDKSENATPSPAPAAASGGPSLEVRQEPGANGKAKLKKEKSKSKLKDHQHILKGRGKWEPNRECVIM